MEYQSPLAVVPVAAPGRGQKPEWIVPARPEPRGILDQSERTRAPRDRAELKQATLEARTALREAATAAAVAAQRAFTYVQVLDEALAALQRADGGAVASLPAAKAPGPLLGQGLSPRERDVLALVAEGRSNKAIAATLSVSPNTVKTHVASLLGKLNADSRTQLAAMAVRGACQ